ncbi:ABC transporter substrate-binding protein [Pontibacter ramchanderi]|uniref:ABC-type branched-subunit amino acid transport system substrate-binding protein n=1 Tax=Pontibacter ramchanderi TaxID=1179743 RepID=A0A2N3U7G6_9BACT|nr:ABC transporter substrate-binding protein [Pontibacter ramchanderi]PKV62700.1 ABC-type branched-subunit amino acid transport system substrate-binding protein [Pontibacter ramchanderi]
MNRSFLKHTAGMLLLAALALPAQAQQDFSTTYGNGKVLIEREQYDKAMAELLPITQAGPKNQYAPEASYLYAVAALKANKLPEARRMLQQLQGQHPTWPNQTEASYLLANVLFEQGEFEQALAELSSLSSNKLQADAENLKRHYLMRITDRETFEQLLQRYPDDKALAQTFADKLLAGWYRPEDKSTLENIVSKHRLDRNRYLSANAMRKQAYTVAALLPFQLDQDLGQAARKNQFATDLYAGMKMAQDSLKRQGININLYAYDAGTDTTAVKRILETPEIKSMDLLIGPVYRSSAKIVNRFAAQNNVNVINPLSQDLEVAGENPNIFLFESSVATQARQAATYAYNTFEPKTAIILYEDSKDDIAFSQYYREQFLKLGGKIAAYKKINSKQTSATAAVFKELKLEGIGHLAVFSDQMTAAANTVSTLQARAATLPLLTFENWLGIGQLTLRQLDDLEIYFVNPKYVDQMNSVVRHFRKRYAARYNMPPSPYAYAGFEMMYYFGTLLQNYGPRFNLALGSEGLRPGVFYKGIGYTDRAALNEVRRDNQYIPITKLENLQLTVVNPVF